MSEIIKLFTIGISIYEYRNEIYTGFMLCNYASKVIINTINNNLITCKCGVCEYNINHGLKPINH